MPSRDMIYFTKLRQLKPMTLEKTAHLFKALSEPLRLRIVSLLTQRESLCVCDLVAALDQGQSTISRHLNYLKNAGLVTSWREGTWMHYQLTPSTDSLDFEQLKQSLSNLKECTQDLAALKSYETSPRNCKLNSNVS